jgi:predicted ATPase
MQTKGYAAAETKIALDQARLLIERAEAIGESLEDPLLLYSVLFGFWGANFIAFNGNTVLGLAAQFLALAERQGTTIPLMIGHRLMGPSLLFTGNIAEGRTHLDRAIALYDPVKHRSLVARFGHDVGVLVSSYRSLALWLFGCPDMGLADSGHALKDAREIAHSSTLMNALLYATIVHSLSGNYATTNAIAHELIALGSEKSAPLWQAAGVMGQGCIFALTGRASDAVQTLTSLITAYLSTGAFLLPFGLVHLARAHADLADLDEARRRVDEAMSATEATGERWFEADIHRTAGEIVLRLPERGAAKAEMYFERALAVARAQQTKSLELRAAMSMARLWRDQGKRRQAHDFLAPGLWLVHRGV